MLASVSRAVQPQYPARISPRIPFPLLACYSGGVGHIDIGSEQRGAFSVLSVPGISAGHRIGRGASYDGFDDVHYLVTRSWAAYPVTLGGVFRKDASPSAGAPFALNTASGSRHVSIFNSAGTTVDGEIRPSTAAAVIVTGPTFTVGESYGAIFCSRNASDHRLYVNGQMFTSTTTAAAFDNSFIHFSTGAEWRGAAINTDDCTVGLAWAALAIIEDSLALELSVNPWALFSSTDDSIMAIAAGQPPRSMHQFRLRRAA